MNPLQSLARLPRFLVGGAPVFIGILSLINESFLKNYPDHELADDVQFSLKNLGKSPEDIIKEFEMRNKAESDSTALSEE